MAAAAGNYKRILELLEKLPIDKSKSGRDLGEYLYNTVKQAYKANKFENNYKYWDRQYLALQRLVSNEHRDANPRILQSTATGLTAEQCHIALSNEFLEELRQEDEPLLRKIMSHLSNKKQ